jgi:hypothetical protein
MARPLYLPLPRKKEPKDRWVVDCVGARTDWNDVEKKKIFLLSGIPTLNPRSSSPYPVAILTALSRLLTMKAIVRI